MAGSGAGRETVFSLRGVVMKPFARLKEGNVIVENRSVRWVHHTNPGSRLARAAQCPSWASARSILLCIKSSAANAMVRRGEDRYRLHHRRGGAAHHPTRARPGCVYLASGLPPPSCFAA